MLHFMLFQNQYFTFGPPGDNLRAELGLKVGNGASRIYNRGVLTVIGREQGFYSYFFTVTNPTVEDYTWLRPVLNNEVYISNAVAFSSYFCGHNVFFQYRNGFYPPVTCPIGDSEYRENDSVSIP